MQLLKRFSNGVDGVKQLLKSAKNIRSDHRVFSDYLLQVQQSTDALPQRKQRAEMFRGLFAGILERKDDQRIFSPEQRRILWNSEVERTCSRCGESSDWTNFQVDHIKPHSKGGMTVLNNAALICIHCNVAKGAR